MKNQQCIFISFCIILVGAALSDACSCAYEHPQRRFCDSQYVFQASILTRKKRENGLYYRTYVHQARVFKVFKAPENSTLLNRESRNATIVSPIDDSMCGITLRRRVKYALTGREVGNELVVNLCSMVMEWRALTKQEKKGLHRKYHKNCDCKVERCHGGSCPTIQEDFKTDKCYWDTFPQHRFCYEHHSICQHNREGGCEWMKPKDLRSCITDTLDYGSGGGEP